MEDLGQTDYLLHIQDFASADAINALERIELRRSSVVEQIRSYQLNMLSVSSCQYDALIQLVSQVRQRSN